MELCSLPLAALHPKLQIALASVEEQQKQKSRFSRCVEHALVTVQGLGVGMVGKGITDAVEAKKYMKTSAVRMLVPDGAHSASDELKYDAEIEDITPQCQALDKVVKSLGLVCKIGAMDLTNPLPQTVPSKVSDGSFEEAVKQSKSIPPVGLSSGQGIFLSAPASPEASLPAIDRSFEEAVEQSKSIPPVVLASDQGLMNHILDPFCGTVEEVFRRTHTFLCHGNVSPAQRYMNLGMAHAATAAIWILAGCTLFVGCYALKHYRAEREQREKYAQLAVAINQELHKTSPEAPHA